MPSKFVNVLVSLGVVTTVLVACQVIKPVDVLNAVATDSTYSLRKDISFGPLDRLKLDIYEPTEGANGETVIFIYGGAWRMGSKDDYEFVAQSLTEEGYTVVIPDYRLYPMVQYPAIIDDVALAIEFLKTENLGITSNTNEFILIGHSSGAHAAAMLTSKARYYRDDSTVKALIGISGPYDLPIELEEVADVFPNVENPDSVKPIRNITLSHPRTLLIHGTGDDRVDVLHSRRYYRALVANNVPATLELLKDVGHTDIMAGVATPLSFLNDTRSAILAFLDTQDQER